MQAIGDGQQSVGASGLLFGQQTPMDVTGPPDTMHSPPQRPQFVRVFKGVSQPSVMSLLQLPHPVSHAIPH